MERLRHVGRALGAATDETRDEKPSHHRIRVSRLTPAESSLRRYVDEQNSSVALVDGEGTAVSSAKIITQRLRIGSSATVLTGGIGGVATLEEHRRKGLSSTVMTAAVEEMRARRLPLSHLFGVAGFYEQFGYVSVGISPHSRLAVSTAVAAALPPAPALPPSAAAPQLAIRPATLADAPAMLRVHELDNARRTLTVVRDERIFTSRLQSLLEGEPVRWGAWGALPWIITRSTGSALPATVIGYFILRFDQVGAVQTNELAAYLQRTDNIGRGGVAPGTSAEGTAMLEEVALLPDAAGMSALPVLARFVATEAEAAGYSRIECGLPPAHPCSEYLRYLGPAIDIQLRPHNRYVQ